MNEKEIKNKVVSLVGLMRANNEPAAAAVAIELAVQVLVDLNRIANALEAIAASKNSAGTARPLGGPGPFAGNN